MLDMGCTPVLVAVRVIRHAVRSHASRERGEKHLGSNQASQHGGGLRDTRLTGIARTHRGPHEIGRLGGIWTVPKARITVTHGHRVAWARGWLLNEGRS